MFTAIDKLAIKLEFASSVIPVNGLRHIVDALRQGHSYQTYRENNPPTFKSYWMAEHQNLIVEIFVLATTQGVILDNVIAMLKANFDDQLALIQASGIYTYAKPVQQAPRLPHTNSWTKFEKEYLVVNNPLGGTRLDKIDAYRQRQLVENKSDRWFFAMVYADQSCLSISQKRAFQHEHSMMSLWFDLQASVLTEVQKELAEEWSLHYEQNKKSDTAFYREVYDLLSDEQKNNLTKEQKEKLFGISAPKSREDDDVTERFDRIVAAVAANKRLRRKVERMGMVEYPHDEDDFEEKTPARSAHVKRARVGKKSSYSESIQDFTDLDNHIVSHIRKQSVNQSSSNTSFFQQRKNDYLTHTIVIPPMPDTPAADISNQAKQISDRLVSLFGISRTRIKSQIAPEMHDAKWESENVYFNSVGTRIAKIIRDDVPIGAVVVFGAAIATVSRKVKEMIPQTQLPDQSSSALSERKTLQVDLDHDSDSDSSDIEIITRSSTSSVLSTLGTIIVLPAAITAKFSAVATVSKVQTLMKSVSELELELLRRQELRQARDNIVPSSDDDDNASAVTRSMTRSK